MTGFSTVFWMTSRTTGFSTVVVWKISRTTGRAAFWASWTLSLLGSTRLPLGRSTNSGPRSPTQVGPPRQLLVPSALEPTLPPSPPPIPSRPLTFPATQDRPLPMPSTMGLTLDHTLETTLAMPLKTVCTTLKSSLKTLMARSITGEMTPQAVIRMSATTGATVPMMF